MTAGPTNTHTGKTKKKTRGRKEKRDWKAIAPSSRSLSEREYGRWTSRYRQYAGAATALNRMYLKGESKRFPTKISMDVTFYDIERSIENLATFCSEHGISKTSVDDGILALQQLKRLVPDE